MMLISFSLFDCII